MRENSTGLFKIVGIGLLLVTLWAMLSFYVPEKFLSPLNIENLLRRTALYGILGIGVAFVIMTGGIDLSIGSMVCLCGCLLAMFLQVDYLPVNEVDVWEVRASDSTIVVEADAEFRAGERVRYYNGRKARNQISNVVSVQPVQFNGKSALSIVLDQPPSRDDVVDKSAKSIGKLVPVLAIREITKELPEGKTPQVVVATTNLSLKPRDRIWMVLGVRGMSEETVTGVESSGENTIVFLKSQPIGVTTEWNAIPIRRSPRMSIPVAVSIVMGIALCLGLIHGMLITKLRQQAFVVTLCGLMIYRGLARWFSNDQTLGFGNEYVSSLGALSTGRLVLWRSAESDASFGIPFVLFIFIIVAILAAVILNLTIWGRYILALGKNQEAAKYSGINTGRMICLTYVLCALATGLGGLLHTIDANSIAPSSFGNWFELWAIAAAVLGGCSLRGGEGSIFGVVVGTALMQTLYNMIILLQISSELEYVIIGMVILLGVVSDELIRRVASVVRRR